MALLLVRAGVRTTLLCRSAEQAAELTERGENERYLPGVPLPKELKVRAFGGTTDQFHRADLVFLAVPSKGLAEALAELERQGVARAPASCRSRRGSSRPTERRRRSRSTRPSGRNAWPASAARRTRARWRPRAPGLVCASHSEKLAHRVAGLFQRAGVVCEVSDDPVGVELAGCAKNAAAVAVGATEAQGLNAAGMAAADIFSEVAALAEQRGGQARTFLGRAGTGDLVATALAPKSRNRSAGELLAPGRSRRRDPGRALTRRSRRSRPCRCWPARSSGRHKAPVTSALARLIAGELPLEDWIGLVRAEQPEPARFAAGCGRGGAACWRWFAGEAIC